MTNDFLEAHETHTKDVALIGILYSPTDEAKPILQEVLTCIARARTSKLEFKICSSALLAQVKDTKALQTKFVGHLADFNQQAKVDSKEWLLPFLHQELQRVCG